MQSISEFHWLLLQQISRISLLTSVGTTGFLVTITFPLDACLLSDLLFPCFPCHTLHNGQSDPLKIIISPTKIHQWLFTSPKVKSKILIMASKTLHGLAPSAPSDLISITLPLAHCTIPILASLTFPEHTKHPPTLGPELLLRGKFFYQLVCVTPHFSPRSLLKH